MRAFAYDRHFQRRWVEAIRAASMAAQCRDPGRAPVGYLAGGTTSSD